MPPRVQRGELRFSFPFSGRLVYITILIEFFALQCQNDGVSFAKCSQEPPVQKLLERKHPDDGATKLALWKYRNSHLKKALPGYFRDRLNRALFALPQLLKVCAQ